MGIILKAINCGQQAEPLGQLSLYSDAGRSSECLLLLASIKLETSGTLESSGMLWLKYICDKKKKKIQNRTEVTEVFPEVTIL